MDQADLGSEIHATALRDLSRINWWSRSSAIVWKALELEVRTSPGREWSVLDIASGAGDVTCNLAQRAGQQSVALRLLGCDVSPTAVSLAQRRAAMLGVEKQVAFDVRDVLRQPLPGDFDIVMCSLFLHHLDKDDALSLLRKMAASARHLVLVNDLRRTRLGYAMAWLGTRLLSRSPIVHFDGPVSVEGAFTGEEVLQLADQAGMKGSRLTYHWPQRFLLSWKRG